ncbi:hypothetical protein [Aquimonas voraii]|uniref:Uncharacterized protein n=1 Tax=Aquimonas voraii TaxID=265719 RepID=A0A1G7AF57_9GAMM|nr:hypothetical protein [Aquimonas voraii]SDE13087.1 hypothetical protein SAMN04488509_1243 [Aquimonas voraii]
MRVFVFGLITAGSFMMLSADTRGVDLPSAEWCSTGTLVPVAEFHFYPEAFEGLRAPGFKMVGQFDDDYDTNPREDGDEEEEERLNSIAPPTSQLKMVGQFDDDYDTNPREDGDEEAEERLNSIAPPASQLKMVGQFDDDYDTNPREDGDEEAEERLDSIAPGASQLKMVGEFDDDYDTNPREDGEEEAEQVRTALAMASTHCEQFTLSKRGGGDRGQVIAVAEWPQSLIKSDAGRYSLSQGAAGVCLRCQ